jgi:methylmalonyl-CoA mutase
MIFIDSCCKEVIIGVNKFKVENDSTKVDVLSIDNTAVRLSQIEKLKAVKVHRNTEQAKASLEALTQAVKTGKGNLLALAIDASRKRCTVGEITAALEEVWGRHNPTIRVISGAYKSEYGSSDDISKTLSMVEVN